MVQGDPESIEGSLSLSTVEGSEVEAQAHHQSFIRHVFIFHPFNLLNLLGIDKLKAPHQKVGGFQFFPSVFAC
jgi:hypothetical protein